MARGRIISRSLGSSRKFSELRQRAGKLGEFAQSLYPLLIVNADDFGRMAGDAFSVKFDVFPTCPRSETEFGLVLTCMHDVTLVILYEHDGATYLQITDFERHQAGLHKRTHSRFPGPSGKFPELPLEEKRTEENRRRDSRGPLVSGNGTADAAAFDSFWFAYPRKVAKGAAQKAWSTLHPSGEILTAMLAALKWQREQPDWLKDDGGFIPHPATWLNGARWEDEPPPPGDDDFPQYDWAAMECASGCVHEFKKTYLREHRKRADRPCPDAVAKATA